ncbi:SGNH/GDSL hydrolase family protein [Coraliomargarita algicola]|uniref:SGNH/GDSL hydrolase family protein n=1 Tax=Coraliomargarita algicola TaxID=3092156 RepID=A0ABZ0RJI7_9BACT|nr:SGNH/GDSL hydrolase family protein [Coraliomargarita sp. J2-16]WPJ95566.1 SGNH/GDSL hydrolase family protein [Coraliomargarita sp. J2-16]
MSDINSKNVATVIREPIEWTRSWVPDSDKSELDVPRVLLVGDSIVMGYGPKASEHLQGEVSLAWVGTSRFPVDPIYFEEIALVLRSTSFDAVHFNNGLHGFGYDESDYAACLKQVVTRLRVLTPAVPWMLANSTPLRKPDDLKQYTERNDRVRLRNQTMAALAAEFNLSMTDLYQAMEGHPEYYSPDGTHFNETGIAVQGELVAESIRQLITQ